MEKFYLVCPECLGVEEASEARWYESFSEVNWYYYRRDEEGRQEWEKKDIEAEHLYTRHEACGFESGKGWLAEDFEVIVENGKIVYVGAYWEENVETLEKALRKAGILEDKEEKLKKKVKSPRIGM